MLYYEKHQDRCPQGGRHDPQLFIDWTLKLDRYFTWYELTEFRKVKYAVMKLSGQASQYWTNLENRRATRGRPPIDTSDRMKEELETKYVPPLFSARLMDNWHQHTQSNKSAKEYVEKFNEFLKGR